MSVEQSDTEATLRECLWVAQNALSQIKTNGPSAYWRGIADEALEHIDEMMQEVDRAA